MRFLDPPGLPGLLLVDIVSCVPNHSTYPLSLEFTPGGDGEGSIKHRSILSKMLEFGIIGNPTKSSSPLLSSSVHSFKQCLNILFSLSKQV
ncbi:hypothetical protein F5X96DRAFT_662803 [Biscogniauxia mediterranea]|nr:hypothetical protein F5X96DRAFT_662803 [Biscogniauxia mediterranea]